MSDADVIVVGAGTAGGLVAEVLARRGLRVVILEAGPRIERWALVERFRNGTDRDDFMQPYPGVAHAPQGLGSESDYIIQNGPDPYLTQYVRAVGGTTWHWAAACWRFLPNDFRLRSLYGVVRLTARNASQKRSSGWLSLMIRNLILPVVIPLGIKGARRSYAFRVDRDPLSAPAT